MLAESNRMERKTNQRKAGHVHANMGILCTTGLYSAVLLRQHPELSKNLLNITETFVSSEQCPKMLLGLCHERFQCLVETLTSFVHLFSRKHNATVFLSPALRSADVCKASVRTGYSVILTVT